MGADLYITPLYEQQRYEWEQQFEAAVRQREKFPAGSAEFKKAQARVEECYDKLQEQGYFRDPYNDWDVLWKFGLSWWEDVIPMLDEDNRLSVAQAKNLLTNLHERENVFALKLATLPAKEQQYFRKRYAALEKFLNQAIELNTPIDTWL